MAKSAMGISVTRVSTDQEAPLGYIHVEPAVSVGTDANQGERHWVYVWNDTGTDSTAFAAGDIIQRDPSSTTQDMYGGELTPITTAQPAHSILGVAQHAIASGSYGFILCKGQGVVKNGTGNITADTAITSGGSRVGSAIDLAANAEHCVIGYSLEAEATNDTTFDAYINCTGA